MCGDQLHIFSDHLSTRKLHPHSEGDYDFRAQTQSEVICQAWSPLAECLARRVLEGDDHFVDGDRQALAGPDVERHASPAPSVNEELNGRIGLYLRVPRHAFFLPITAKLSTQDIRSRKRPNSFKQARLFIPDRVVVFPCRGIHGEAGQHLQQVILNHVADRAGFFVKPSATLDTEVLRHGDLYGAYVSTVPDRLEKQ